MKKVVLKLSALQEHIIADELRKAESIRTKKLLALSLLNNAQNQHNNLTIKDVAKLVGLSERVISTLISALNNGDNLDELLTRKQYDGAGRKIKYDDEFVFRTLELTKSKPPQGFKNWTINLLAQTLVMQYDYETVTKSAVQRVLAKHKIKLNSKHHSYK